MGCCDWKSWSGSASVHYNYYTTSWWYYRLKGTISSDFPDHNRPASKDFRSFWILLEFIIDSPGTRDSLVNSSPEILAKINLQITYGGQINRWVKHPSIFITRELFWTRRGFCLHIFTACREIHNRLSSGEYTVLLLSIRAQITRPIFGKICNPYHACNFVSRRGFWWIKPETKTLVTLPL
jgi:hypothetical protein